MKEKLIGAQLLIEARDMKIQECELALETERQRVAIYQDERDRAIARCKAEADLKATEQQMLFLGGYRGRCRNLSRHSLWWLCYRHRYTLSSG